MELRPTLLDLRPRELEERLVELGQPRFRGRQLAGWLYQKGIASLDEATNLPAKLREQLAHEPGLPRLSPDEVQQAADGTTKYLLGLDDGARIEAVAMPRPTGGTTYCLSSQVGCRMGCVFCATGRMGIVRNLRAGEIVGQVLELRRRHPQDRHPNLVFMGMGEPLDNFDELARALDILCDPDGVGLGARRITVSTSGLVEGIRRLGTLGRPYGLAVSLTTGIPEERRKLMPVAGKVPVEQLLEVAAGYGRSTKRKVTLECATIAGVNDDLEHAERLLRWARTGPFKVNLIPLNPVDGFDGARPDMERVRAMADHLWKHGVVATVRDSQGRDVEAACGQLVRQQERREGMRPQGKPR